MSTELDLNPAPSIQDLTPISSTKRIDAMDILRGLALIGILLMNIEWFNRAMVELATQDKSLTGLDHAIGWLIRCFVEGKFYKLFALLFGMGFAVMLIRARAADRPFGAWFSRRMLVLFIIGLLHMAFIWGGDILHDYAFAGMFLLAYILILQKERFKKYDNPRSMFKLAIVWLCLPIVFSVLFGIGYGVMKDDQSLEKSWIEERAIASAFKNLEKQNRENITEIPEKELANEDLNIEKLNESFDQEIDIDLLSPEEKITYIAQTTLEQKQEHKSKVNDEITAFTQSSYWQATLYRIEFMGFMLMFTPAFTFTMLFPIFLLGFWLISSGIMENKSKYQNAFKATAWLGIGLGLLLEVGGLLVSQHPVANEVMLIFGVGNGLFTIGQYVMSAGYFGLVMALINSEKWHQRLTVFAPMGKMALTNYIMHSIILTSIFYGYAGGYYGEISRAPQMIIVFAIILFQLIGSKWWLNKYKLGPLEWLWRSLTYKKMQKMRIQ